MLSRNARIEQDLIDQLFNSSEKRLVRALLLLARYGEQDEPRGGADRYRRSRRRQGPAHALRAARC
jgi:hypothetical protein